MNISQIKSVIKTIFEVNNDNKSAWHATAYENRWKYFFRSWIFIIICVSFFFLGYVIRDSFFSPIGYYAWMLLSGIFLIIGTYTMLSYLRVIIRGKK